MLRALRRPIRTVLVWQLAVTALIAVTAAIVAVSLAQHLFGDLR